MKKHVRFCLFAALLVALLGVTVLCAAAAGNYQVLNDADAEVGTYATLAEAKAVVRDNYTIKLLDDTTETANTALNVNYTYTVDGDGHTITNTGDVAFLTVSRGDVTFKDVTLDHKTTATDKHIFLISGSPTLTLNGVTLLGGYRDFNLTSSGTPHVTVTGASDLGRGVGDRIAHLGNASRSGCLTIENGTFTCGPNYGIVGSGAKIVVRGGTFTTDDKPFVTREFCGALGIPRVSFAPAEKLKELTGVEVGATTILSSVLPECAPVHLVIDRSVAGSEWFACTDGTATCFVKIRTTDLLDKYIPASGHSLKII